MAHVIDLTWRDVKHVVTVFEAASYASGDRIIFTDAPWIAQSIAPVEPIIAFREVQGQWRRVWGDPSKAFDWLTTAQVSDVAKISNKRLTKIDPSMLPASIDVGYSDAVSW